MRTIAALLLVACIACAGADAPRNAPDIRQYVAGAAAESIDAGGRFILPAPQMDTGGTVVTANDALQLATAYVSSIATIDAFRRQIAMDHGSDVDLAKAVASTRLEFIETAFEPAPSSYPGFIARDAASSYLVRFFVGATPILSVSVSVRATDLAVQEGKIVSPPVTGGEFQESASALLYGPDWSFPISPERAAIAAATQTKAKVVSVPVLQSGHRDLSKALALWKVTLSRQVGFLGLETGTSYESETVYVGTEFLGSAGVNITALYLPLVNQPAIDDSDPDLPFTVKEKHPLDFERVMLTAP